MKIIKSIFQVPPFLFNQLSVFYVYAHKLVYFLQDFLDYNKCKTNHQYIAHAKTHFWNYLVAKLIEVQYNRSLCILYHLSQTYILLLHI